MSIIDNLTNEATKINASEDEVVNEIIEFFRNKLNDESYEARLQEFFYEENIKARRKELTVEFWDYNSGCSDTHFYVTGIRWNNPVATGWESRRYKNICLRDIQRKVGPKLLTMFKNKLEEFGFTVHSYSNESWLQYYKQKIVVTW